MSTALIPQIDIETYTETWAGLRPQSIAHIGSAFAILTPLNIEAAFLHLQQTFGLFSSYFDVSSLPSADDVVSLLDSGAAKVFVHQDQLAKLKTVENLDFGRVVLNLSRPSKDDIVEALGGGSSSTKVGAGGIHVWDVQGLGFVRGWLREQGNKDTPVYMSLGSNTSAATLADVEKFDGVPIIAASALTVDPEKESELLPVAKVLLSSASSDRQDGLYSTIVTDERGVALGLVFSSEKSVAESLRTGKGVYHSRTRGLWYKGETSGDVQELVRVGLDCDQDCLQFVVRQKGRGFCHLATATCFGQYSGLGKLQQTLASRIQSAPKGSYTARLFSDTQLLRAKIMEEANELCEATTKEDVAFEAADLIFFALTKCIAAGVRLEDVEQNLDSKSVKVKRRRGDAKIPLAPAGTGSSNGAATATAEPDKPSKIGATNSATTTKAPMGPAEPKDDRIRMSRYYAGKDSLSTIHKALERPSQKSSEKIMSIVNPIIADVRSRGDKALLEYTHKFEKATSLTSPVMKAPFPKSLMQLPPETIEAIDTSFENIRRFHAAQKEEKPLTVETMPGVICSRFARPIERVGLYVPGGTAVLPSTAMMLGVPAMVAGCKKIVIASPPRADGSITPEIVYVANKVGAESIVLAGGAQAVAAMAYGTESVSKVDKILGPGNQFVTAAKMVVSNDTSAGVSIDMPAGPSEVLVIADETANPAFVASDLLSQAEHGVDSQVVCIAVALSERQIQDIEGELHMQANALPRVEIVRGAIRHSVTLVVKDIAEAMELSNYYAPEHLILQVKDAQHVADTMVQSAGSVFIGPWTPESVGDYSAGVNHSLPTYGYAKQYSGVNLGSYIKHITASNLTAQGLRNVGGAVMQLAKVEELDAHLRAVKIRLEHMDAVEGKSST